MTDQLRQAAQQALEALIDASNVLSATMFADAVDALKAALEQQAETVVQRPWVGLTDEEIWETVSRIGTSDSDVNPYAKLADVRAIEAKLKERNG